MADQKLLNVLIMLFRTMRVPAKRPMNVAE